ncbi:MAG: hypothetical protein ABH956_00080 [Candidatus Nealsonbacteria bacterium]
MAIIWIFLIIFKQFYSAYIFHIAYWNIFGLGLRTFYFGYLKHQETTKWYSTQQRKDCYCAYMFYALVAFALSSWICISSNLFQLIKDEPMCIWISIPIFILIGLASGSQKILSLLK